MCGDVELNQFLRLLRKIQKFHTHKHIWRFVNHSRRPNANFDGEELVALRPILLGEEITHNYGEDWGDVG